MTVDLDALARAYWTSTPYDDHVHDTTMHPFDAIQDIVLDADEPQLSALLHALAISAPTEADVARIGTTWVEGLEYRFDAEGSTGRSISILLEAGLDEPTVNRILSGVDPTWLAAMGAEALLIGELDHEHIAWLVDPAAPGRAEFLQ